MKISNSVWVLIGILCLVFLTSFQSPPNNVVSSSQQSFLEFKQVNKELIYVNIDTITYVTQVGKNTRLSFLNGSYAEIDMSYGKAVDAIRKLQVK